MKKLLIFLSLAVLAQASLAQTSAQEDYVLHTDDVITVTVVKHPEFSGDFLIPSAGMIDVPAVGPFKASGMSLAQASSYIRQQLAKRLRNPEVSVVLKSTRLRRFSVIGAVNRPGPYELKAGWRVAEAIGAAGGLPAGAPTKDFRASLIRSGTNERVPIALTEALAGDEKANVLVAEGDVLNIEAIELVPIYVMGKVKNPALYKLPQDGVGLMEALIVAGGVTDDAMISSIKVIHSDGREESVDLTPVVLKGEKVQMPKIGANDLIVVPEATARVAVMGTVLAPGFFPLPEGKEVRLAEAVAFAKVDPKRSRLARVGLVRVEDGKEKRYQFDVGKYLKTGDSAHNPVLKPGDMIYVPETDKFDWSQLSLAGLLFRAFK